MNKYGTLNMTDEEEEEFDRQNKALYDDTKTNLVDKNQILDNKSLLEISRDRDVESFRNIADDVVNSNSFFTVKHLDNPIIQRFLLISEVLEIIKDTYENVDFDEASEPINMCKAILESKTSLEVLKPLIKIFPFVEFLTDYPDDRSMDVMMETENKLWNSDASSRVKPYIKTNKGKSLNVILYKLQSVGKNEKIWNYVTKQIERKGTNEDKFVLLASDPDRKIGEMENVIIENVINSGNVDDLLYNSETLLNKEVEKLLKQEDVDVYVDPDLLYEAKDEKKIPSQIYGPIYMGELYRKSTDQRIYLFGDYHDRLQKCPEKGSINISDLVEYIPVDTDVFLELEYRKDMVKKLVSMRSFSDGPISHDLVYRHRRCLSREEKCPVKFHGVDSRYSEQNANVIVDLKDSLDDFANDVKREGLSLFLEMRSRILKDLEDVVKKYASLDFNDILMTRKISKQISMVDNGDRKKLENFVSESSESFPEIIKRCQNIEKLVLFLKENPPSNTGDVLVWLKAVSNEIAILINNVLYFANILELYTIGRVLKVDNQGNIKKKIVILLGKAHIDILKELFIKLGFELIAEESAVKNSQCVSLEKFNWPLFSQ